MVTKWPTAKIDLKQSNCNFGQNLRAMETDFLRISYQHSKIPKNPYNMVCGVVILKLLLKYLFCICLCAMLISLSNLIILFQYGKLSIFSLFWRPFLLP